MNHAFGMLGLYVQDVEKSKAFYSEVADMGAGRFFRAKDPEGHVLSVYQLYPQVKAMRQ